MCWKIKLLSAKPALNTKLLPAYTLALQCVYTRGVLVFFLLKKIIKAAPSSKEKQNKPNPKTHQILATGVILTKASVFVLAKDVN